MIVKVTYTVDNEFEKSYELGEIRQIHESLSNRILAVEINDASKSNDSKALSEMMNNPIKTVELIDNDNIITFDYFTKLNVVNRIYYDAEDNTKSQTLRLQFLAGE